MKFLKLAVFAVLSAFSGLAFADAVKYEAEDATLTYSEVVSYDDASGGAYVYLEYGSLTWTVTADSSGKYVFTFAFASPLGLKIQYLYVDYPDDGTWVEADASLSFEETDSDNISFDNYVSVTLKLEEGEHTIRLAAGYGYMYLDYMTFDAAEPTVWSISSSPVTSGATENAQKLLGFLKENFGSKTISGIMTGDVTFDYDYDNMELTETDSTEYALFTQEDVAAVYSASGYYPALVGFDMIFATGYQSHTNGWYLGYTEKTIKLSEELWERGGIPNFTWHWKVGEDSAFYYSSSSGSSTFKLTDAFSDSASATWDTSSEAYQLLIADIDTVSKWFLQLQDAGVPAIWRPVHEAAGGWFWWGAYGSNLYVALYQLVYDRMVNVNGVKNLIWVWNIERDPDIGYDYTALSADWYPGDDYVDVIGVDYYNSYQDNSSLYQYWDKIIEEMGTNKIIALTENGPIPDIDSMVTDGAMWSWWMPWYNSWSAGYVYYTSNDVWAKNMEDERVWTLDKMPGWDNYSVSTESEESSSSDETSSDASSESEGSSGTDETSSDASSESEGSSGTDETSSDASSESEESSGSDEASSDASSESEESSGTDEASSDTSGESEGSSGSEDSSSGSSPIVAQKAFVQSKILGTSLGFKVYTNSAAKVEVYNLHGSLVKAQDVSAGETQVTGINAGVYFVKLSDGTKGMVKVRQ